MCILLQNIFESNVYKKTSKVYRKNIIGKPCMDFNFLQRHLQRPSTGFCVNNTKAYISEKGFQSTGYFMKKR